MALVGGGRFPFEWSSKVVIYDEILQKRITTISFNKAEVKGIHITKKYLIVALESTTYIYLVNENFVPLTKIDTAINNKGIFSLVQINDEYLIAVPYQKDDSQRLEGNILIKNLDKLDQTQVIKAHNHPIINITFNHSGSLLATASRQGTLIKIWETATGQCITMIRRGYDICTIHQLAFDATDNWIVCINDQKAIGIFSLTERLVDKK